MAMLPTITELLDDLKRHLSITSDYALAKHLGLSKTTTSNWKHGFSAPDDLECLHIAELANLSAQYVLALVHANRQKYRPAAPYWAQIFELAKAHALANGWRVL